MTNKKTTTATATATVAIATPEQAFKNATLNSQIEKDLYKAGNDLYKHKLSGVKIENNQAELLDTIVAECVTNDDYSPIERVGLKHKTFDFKNANIGEKGEPLNCKAFKTAISKAFNRAEVDLSLKGCGKGGVPTVGSKDAPKGKAKAKAKSEGVVIAMPSELPVSSDTKEAVWDYVVNNFSYSDLVAMSENWAKVNEPNKVVNG